MKHRYNGHVRWLVLVLVWAGWCWFFVRGKHCWLTGLGWLKPTSEQAEYLYLFVSEIQSWMCSV